MHQSPAALPRHARGVSHQQHSLVLLPAVQDDIAAHKRLNFHLYLALKKALYKPAAFFKGVLLPLAEARATLREALIVGSVLSKVSVRIRDASRTGRRTSHTRAQPLSSHPAPPAAGHVGGAPLLKYLPQVGLVASGGRDETDGTIRLWKVERVAARDASRTQGTAAARLLTSHPAPPSSAGVGGRAALSAIDRRQVRPRAHRPHGPSHGDDLPARR